MNFRIPFPLQILLSVALTGFLRAAEKPNIVIIFTDDQGYGDLACYGNKKTKTPRLDQLAKEGTKYTSFYSQTVCGPSRSALLTGRQPLRSKGWGMPASEITWAELIRKAGYQTACIGKPLEFNTVRTWVIHNCEYRMCCPARKYTFPRFGIKTKTGEAF